MDDFLPIICGLVAAVTVALVPFLLKWSIDKDLVIRLWPPMIKIERREH